MYVLEVMSGPLDGTRWRFDQDITIGRDDAFASACVAIDRYLSRAHAKVEVEEDALRLTDLTSRNGTTIAGRVVASESLSLGQRFTCGRTLLRVLPADTLDVPQPLMRIDPAIEIVTTIEELRRRRPSGTVGFVPTMGALHEGHLSLVDRATEECTNVVASVFVNPLQFAPNEDLDRYPRDLEQDAALLEEHGVSLLFAPDAGEMYGPEFSTTVDVGEIGRRYEGEARPTHFSGVATVVTKLIHIVGPTRVYLGQKDAQQVAVLNRLVRDLALPCDLVIVPTDREPDGVARSSRNVYLSPEERRRAPMLYRALLAIADAYRAGSTRNDAVAVGRGMIERAFAEPDAAVIAELGYLDIVDPISYLPVEDDYQEREVALAIGALRLGAVRLIDNVRVSDR